MTAGTWDSEDDVDFLDTRSLDEAHIDTINTVRYSEDAGDPPGMIQAQSEDTWVDIDATSTQQPDDPFAARIESERQIAERSRRDVRNANNKVLRLEGKLANACEERDAANKLCDELKNATAKVRQFHADQLNIARAEYEASRQEWENREGSFRAEMDAERLRHAEAIATAELKYQKSVESAEREYEELRVICEQDRTRHEHQLDVASSDWEARTKEAQQYCEYLGAEMEAEHLQHAEAIADAKMKYQAQLESSARQSEQLRVLIEEQRSKYEQRLDSADSNNKTHIEETKRHCEDLRAEMDEERRKHAKVIEDNRAYHEAFAESSRRQHQKDKAAMLEELRKGSVMKDEVEFEHQNLLKAIEGFKLELSAQLSIVKQRDSHIEYLQGYIAMVHLERNAMSSSLKDSNNKAEVEAKRPIGELNLGTSDQRRPERTISRLKDELEHATPCPSDPANACAHEEEIEILKARLKEISAQKIQSPCDDCTRLDREITDLGMVIDSLEYELGLARAEAWQYCSEATEIQNELVRTRQENAVEVERLTSPFNHPLVIRINVLTNATDIEVALIKMNLDTPFKGILDNLRQEHPLKALKVGHDRFVFESDTPARLGLKDGATLFFFQEGDEPKVMLDATMDLTSSWRGKDATI